MRVAENRAAYGTRRPGPRLEPGGPSLDGPSHQPVDRDGRISADAFPVNLLDVPAPRADHEPAYAAIADEHIGSATEQRHADPAHPGKPKRGHDLIGGPRLEEPFGGSADLECRVGRQRHLDADALGPEPSFHLFLETGTTLHQAPPLVDAALRARSRWNTLRIQSSHPVRAARLAADRQ